MTRAYVLHPDLRSAASLSRAPEALLAEAVNLTEALDLNVVGADVVPLTQPRAGWLFGSGKIEELGGLLHGAEVELVIVNGAITPKQQQNLEKTWKVKILDRTGLILEIFGDRAQTREGSMQVELAHLEYQKSRLVRAWTHLERQRGGLGFVGGPGETQIEADRRALSERMGKLRRQLSKTVQTRGLQRAARKRAPYPVVALVGYTNAGKSTLFNRLTGAKVLAKDMLFATLDPTMRGIQLSGGRQIILSDTVGFVADLPTQLIAAFRATLEEVLEADVVVHVRDASHVDSDAQGEDVLTTLRELGLEDERLDRIITVYNKLDLLPEDEAHALRNRLDRAEDVLAMSALTGEGAEAFQDLINERLGADEVTRDLHIDHAEGAALAWLYRHTDVLARRDEEDGAVLTVRAGTGAFAKFAATFPASAGDLVITADEGAAEIA
ncbi:MAG: GTPase HflX [Paracoccaceae bacterium]|jgi:GTPase|nr:GTPase HflX [Paracoccaceae bacterium]